MSGSRPKPGPMTRTWRRESMAMMREAREWGSVEASVVGEGDDGEGEERM